MLYLSVSKAQRALVAVLSFLALASCGGNGTQGDGSQKVTAASSAQTVKMQVATAEQAADTECDTKANYYSIYDYSISAEFTGAQAAWQHFEITLNAAEIDHHAAAQPFKVRFSLFATATACPVSFAAGTQKITNFKVTANDTYSQDYPAGSDITALMVPSFVQTTHYYDWDLASTVPELISETKMAPTSLGMTLSTPPEFPHQEFTVEFTLDDGQSFTLQTGPITFNL